MDLWQTKQMKYLPKGNLKQYKELVAIIIAEHKAHEEKITKRPITVTGRRTQKV